MTEIITSFINFPSLQEMFLSLFNSSQEVGVFFAQVGLEDFMARVLKVFRLVSILFAVIGVMYSAYQLNSGDIRAALLGICASGLMGAAALIVFSLFGEPGDAPYFDLFIEV